MGGLSELYQHRYSDESGIGALRTMNDIDWMVDRPSANDLVEHKPSAQALPYRIKRLIRDCEGMEKKVLTALEKLYDLMDKLNEECVTSWFGCSPERESQLRAEIAKGQRTYNETLERYKAMCTGWATYVR